MASQQVLWSSAGDIEQGACPHARAGPAPRGGHCRLPRVRVRVRPALPREAAGGLSQPAGAGGLLATEQLSLPASPSDVPSCGQSLLVSPTQADILWTWAHGETRFLGVQASSWGEALVEAGGPLDGARRQQPLRSPRVVSVTVWPAPSWRPGPGPCCCLTEGSFSLRSFSPFRSHQVLGQVVGEAHTRERRRAGASFKRGGGSGAGSPSGPAGRRVACRGTWTAGGWLPPGAELRLQGNW